MVKWWVGRMMGWWGRWRGDGFGRRGGCPNVPRRSAYAGCSSDILPKTAPMTANTEAREWGAYDSSLLGLAAAPGRRQ